MRGFAGFRTSLDGQVEEGITLPMEFFSDLLPAIDDLAELKATLYFLAVRARAGHPILFSAADLLSTETPLLQLVRSPNRTDEDALRRVLERAVARGTLIRVTAIRGETRESYYLVNDQDGRQLAERLHAGEEVQNLSVAPATWRVERPNVFVLYEQNIGMLQPLIVDELREAESTYPMSWIEEAFRIAVERNVRNWRYIRAILERWAREGKNDESAQDDSRTVRDLYTKGPYGRIVRH